MEYKVSGPFVLLYKYLDTVMQEEEEELDRNNEKDGESNFQSIFPEILKETELVPPEDTFQEQFHFWISILNFYCDDNEYQFADPAIHFALSWMRYNLANQKHIKTVDFQETSFILRRIASSDKIIVFPNLVDDIAFIIIAVARFHCLWEEEWIFAFMTTVYGSPDTSIQLKDLVIKTYTTQIDFLSPQHVSQFPLHNFISQNDEENLYSIVSKLEMTLKLFVAFPAESIATFSTAIHSSITNTAQLIIEEVSLSREHLHNFIVALCIIKNIESPQKEHPITDYVSTHSELADALYHYGESGNLTRDGFMMIYNNKLFTDLERFNCK